MIELVLGGARSGKSRYAQSVVSKLEGNAGNSAKKRVFYIATAINTDPEMASRIAQHQNDRPSHWQLEERALDLPAAIQNLASTPHHILLVDCLTLWLNNEMYHHPKRDFKCLQRSLIDVLSAAKAQIIIVSNEVGMGIIPMGSVSRRFVDWQGWLNQAVAECAHRVTFVAAGLPLTMKSEA
ncbi:bifunctional adenosylcobinamide kinase/adenosylcobinamide-phosphate guanylyltransferase [Aestuariibacter sp. A3R04]|uniref:bifunctional adenosylcobinamide kinase/adenosylcobinamide-phosphate guanylyltransferase n=1 Tax=Aestuariibacter sp. A3R04 TaxID=2841571 RepID=UPI001C0A6496|nr:bifunctional adenosylcobinamide kinase/adenosylcobinamide-phosphate guanylyltransferase [Aestuariibacter sp. A3R04]MBU3021228.1 bifunctional adenosylcobinamide kinase/adenosylcobinamide-phosphate guanylyltransferase [Aestuariibacter sp. A3R04]